MMILSRNSTLFRQALTSSSVVSKTSPAPCYRLFSCSTVSSSASPTNEGALDGIKVLDFSGALAGPSCAMYLGDLGADVIKIERPGSGDDARKWGPPFLENKTDNPEWKSLSPESAYFVSVNRNKRSFSLNLKDERARQIVHKLAEKADVVLENTTTGKMAKLGLGYEQLSKINPRIIYASITGYGQTGPYAKNPGYDAVVSAEAGMVYSTGEPGGRPVRPGVSITDLFAGFNAFGAILAAIIKRGKTGKGGYIDVSMFDSQAAVMSTVASNWLNSGKEANRLGTAHASVVPYQAFETSDGDIMLACGNDRQFAILSEKFGKPEWATSDKYKTNAGRTSNKDELLSEISKIFKSKSTEYWMTTLKGSGVPHGSINSMEQVFKHPSGIARNLVSEVDHPRSGKVKFVGPAVMYDGERLPVRIPPPVLGQHTSDILSELGMSEEEIKTLKSENVV